MSRLQALVPLHNAYILDAIQYFLCELGMKPRKYAAIKDLFKYDIYVLALQRSSIILVGLMMSCFSEKMMISYNFNLHTWFHAQLAQKILNGI